MTSAPTRFLGIASLAVALAHAPLQCAGEPDGALRRQETPAEALYGLARQFDARGDRAAWRTTLEYLMARYPNSRFAAMARADLETAAPAPSASPP